MTIEILPGTVRGWLNSREYMRIYVGYGAGTNRTVADAVAEVVRVLGAWMK
jgi:hypothetical protein